MPTIDRRMLLAGGAATLAAPALALAQSPDLDVIVVGAGAAGIAAALRVQAAGRRVVVLEASDRIGGRAFSDPSLGTPLDLGANALYGGELNPLARRASAAAVDIVRAAPLAQLRVGRRLAREGETERYLAATTRTRRVFQERDRDARDVVAAQLLPKDLGEWRASAEFAAALAYGKEPGELSAQDLSFAADRNDVAYAAPGVGVLLGKLAQGLTIRLGTPATRISTWRNAYVETPRGALQVRAVIITASTNVLAAGKIKIEPALPPKHLEAFAKLSLGTIERIVLELPGNPLGLSANERVVEQAKDQRTAELLARVAGTAFHVVTVGGKFARELRARGDAAMAAFATEWIGGLFGGDAVKSVGRKLVTQWGHEPWILGSASAAQPGAQELRRALAEPVRERLYFTGEAAHETQWGTIGGAWEAGEKTADAVLKRIGGAARRR